MLFNARQAIGYASGMEIAMARRQDNASSGTKAALGFRAHSGWAAMVVVAGNANSIEIIDRGQIELIDSSIPDSKQPFHTAEDMPLKEATKFIDRCNTKTRLLAKNAVTTIIDAMKKNGVTIVSCASMQSSGKPLPTLENILASHALIHTAEGEFFRAAIAEACEFHNLPLTKIREREVYQVASGRFKLTEEELQERINRLGKLLGPPWRQDEKMATVAGLLSLNL